MEEHAGCHSEDEEEDDDPGRLLSYRVGELDAYEVLVRFPSSELLRGEQGVDLVELQVPTMEALGCGRKKQREKKKGGGGGRKGKGEGS